MPQLSKLQVTLDAPTYRWGASPASENIIQYLIERTIDNGLTWSSEATILNDTEDPLLFDPALNQFFWTDPSPVEGEVVRLAPQDASGTGPWTYVYPVPAPVAVCNLFGIVVDIPSGSPLPDVNVTIDNLQSGLSHFLPGPSTSGFDDSRIGAARRSVTVSTDDHGRWQIDLVQGLVVRVSIPLVSYSVIFRVPPRDILNIRDAWQYRTSIF